ncbi:MAG: type II toxin-antitoxin system RelB/DinJ family antitoxin [Holosporales bacterium]|nr:type II toxin-antitoxin system RelB/DinJ family antitoxin [Holosporales bacterium]
MSNANVNIRVDKSVKDQAKKIFSELGIDMTTAINIFLKQTIREHGFPFDLRLKIPNEKTVQAIKDAENGIELSKTFGSPKEMFNELGI